MSFTSESERPTETEQGKGRDHRTGRKSPPRFCSVCSRMRKKGITMYGPRCRNAGQNGSRKRCVLSRAVRGGRISRHSPRHTAGLQSAESRGVGDPRRGGGTHAESPPPLPEACGPPARTWSLTEVSGLRCATGPSETLTVCELSFWGAGGGTSLRSHETLRIISGHSGERTGFLFKP